MWNRTNGKFLSEEYRAEFTAQGMPADIQKIGALKNLFRDLPAPVTGANDDESVDLVLVVRIVRKGKMVPKEGLKGPDYRHGSHPHFVYDYVAVHLTKFQTPIRRCSAGAIDGGPRQARAGVYTSCLLALRREDVRHAARGHT